MARKRSRSDLGVRINPFDGTRSGIRNPFTGREVAFTRKQGIGRLKREVAGEVGDYVRSRITTTDPQRVARVAKSPEKAIAGAKRAARTAQRAYDRRQFTFRDARSIVKDSALALGGIKGALGLTLLGAAVGSAVYQSYREGHGIGEAFRRGGYQGLDYLAGGGLSTYDSRRRHGDSMAWAATRGGLSFLDTRLLAGLGQTVKDWTVGRDKLPGSGPMREAHATPDLPSSGPGRSGVARAAKVRAATPVSTRTNSAASGQVKVEVPSHRRRLKIVQPYTYYRQV